jgi:general transcription factor IIIA
MPKELVLYRTSPEMISQSQLRHQERFASPKQRGFSVLVEEFTRFEPQEIFPQPPAARIKRLLSDWLKRPEGDSLVLLQTCLQAVFPRHCISLLSCARVRRTGTVITALAAPPSHALVMKRTIQVVERSTADEDAYALLLKKARISSKPPASLVGKPYHCTYSDCDKRYAKPSKLADHVRSHTGERPFCCSEPACNKRFLRKSHLQAHARSHLPKEERPYVCPEMNCAQRFSTNQHLRQHVALHFQPTPYVCEYCQDSFHKNQQLKRHVADVHLKTKPCPCPLTGCNMSFAYQSILDKHVARVHNDAKRYGCEIAECSEKFSKWSLLQAHIKEVHKLRCKYCNKAYSDRTAYKTHLETHEIPLTDRLRYSCTHCDKKFTKSYSLKRHLSFVHQGIREYKCKVCLAEFAHNKTLNAHTAREHGDHSSLKQEKKKRKGLTRTPGLLSRLFGTAYVDSGRHIRCLHDGCPYRFAREYDLDRHLASHHLDLLERPVTQLLQTAT